MFETCQQQQNEFGQLECLGTVHPLVVVLHDAPFDGALAMPDSPEETPGDRKPVGNKCIELDLRTIDGG